MESEQPTEDGFVLFGGYSPKEASKLLKRFEQSGIAFRTQRQRMGYDLTSAILVSVDSKRSADALTALVPLSDQNLAAASWHKNAPLALTVLSKEKW